MKRFLFITMILLLLVGCWDQSELMDRGFILGAAIDENEDKFEMTVQFYRPSMIGTEEGGSREPATFTVKSESISEGARNLVNYFGRRGNWSHMQIIIIGEETARNRDFDDILGFFFREQEPRATTNIMIGKGKGSDYLNFEPMFEFASSRQLREMQQLSHDHAGNTLDMTLHELSLQLQSELEVALVPLVEKDSESMETAALVGVAIIKEGNMIDELDKLGIQHVLVIRKQFKRGIWEIPCKKELSDNVELVVVNSDVSANIDGEQLTVNVDVQFDARIRELMCDTELETTDEVNQYAKKIEETIKNDLEKTISQVQKNKVDILNIGNDIYKKDPRKWNEIKDDWDSYFENAQFTYNVNVDISSTGLVDFEPFMEAD